MNLDGNGLKILDREESLRRLRGVAVGRVAMSVNALPVIVPVNFVVCGDDIVFRTHAGPKLDAALRNTVVAFEVDAVDAVSHAGWSVLVTGHASVLTEGSDLAMAAKLPLASWAAAGPSAYVRILGEVVTGRELDPVTRLATSRAPSSS